MKTLVVGVGNPLRSDDGVAARIVERLGALRHPSLQTVQCHQLTTELTEEMSRYDVVVLVDAAVEGPGVDIQPVTGSVPAAPLSHHAAPSELLSLTERLFNARPRLYVCSVRGEDFQLGETLSAAARVRADEAVRSILLLLEEAQGHA